MGQERERECVQTLPPGGPNWEYYERYMKTLAISGGINGCGLLHVVVVVVVEE